MGYVKKRHLRKSYQDDVSQGQSVLLVKIAMTSSWFIYVSI